MPKTASVQVTMHLNLEGHWRRETYRRLCDERGTAYTEQDYLRWREVGERLSGQHCWETQVEHLSKAFAQFGAAAAKVAAHLNGIDWGRAK